MDRCWVVESLHAGQWLTLAYVHNPTRPSVSTIRKANAYQWGSRDRVMISPKICIRVRANMACSFLEH